MPHKKKTVKQIGKEVQKMGKLRMSKSGKKKLVGFHKKGKK
jgi:hypothetical protein